MANPEAIKRAFERNAKALTRRPSLGQGTAVTRIRLRDGGTCDIEDGPWRLTAGLSSEEGGDGGAPDPGVFGRAALGSCLAQGYAVWAAKLDVHIDTLAVEVHTGYDARGMFGLADLPPGWTGVRYVVTVASPAPEADVRRVLDAADAHSPLLDDFRRALTVEREVRITAPTEAR